MPKQTQECIFKAIDYYWRRGKLKNKVVTYYRQWKNKVTVAHWSLIETLHFDLFGTLTHAITLQVI